MKGVWSGSMKKLGKEEYLKDGGVGNEDVDGMLVFGVKVYVYWGGEWR